MGNPLPALSVRPPEQENLMGMLQGVLGLRNALQTSQAESMKLESMKRSLSDDTIIRQSYIANGGDLKRTIADAASKGVGPDRLIDLQNAHINQQKAYVGLSDEQLKFHQTVNDIAQGALDKVKATPADQRGTAWDEQRARLGQVPGMEQYVAQMPLHYPGDDQLPHFDVMIQSHSAGVKEELDRRKLGAEETSAQGAMLRGQAAAGELALNQQKFAQSPEELARRAAQGDTEAQGILDAQAKQGAQAAGQKAGAEAAAKFPYELQLKQQELAQNPVFAVNPKTGQRELTTVGDAKTQGFTNPVKVSQADLEHETTLNSQLNDLQLNTSRYKAALNAMGPLSKSDVANMTRVLSDKSINSFLTNELTLGVAVDQMSQGEKASAWNALSPDKQAALIGSLRMKNSALLFQKVSTGMGRASKEAMEIEIANMPSPIEGATVGNQKMQSFQENIDQMASRAVKLPWQERSQDVKARIEGQAVDQYNQQQAAKPQGQYRSSKGPVTVGQNIQIANTPGLSRVKKVYPDGTFDADQK